MPYVTQDDIKTLMPADYLAQCLADEGEDSAVVFARIAAAASNAVDAALAQAYTVPFASPVPSLVSEAARIFCAEMLYMRRGVPPDANPFTARATEIRKKLDRVGNGKEPLQPGAAANASDSVAIVTEPSRLNQPGAMLFL